MANTPGNMAFMVYGQAYPDAKLDLASRGAGKMHNGEADRVGNGL
jgi:hypothetical protein